MKDAGALMWYSFSGLLTREISSQVRRYLRMTFADMLNKALKEQDFANLVVADPYAALSQVGIDPTTEKVDALRGATSAMLAALEAIDGIRGFNV
jgi:hypothetical protein